MVAAAENTGSFNEMCGFQDEKLKVNTSKLAFGDEVCIMQTNLYINNL